MDNIKIFALGGLDEDGKNMYVVEVNNKIFVLECGLKYPENDQLGIEMIIPDFSYLIKNKKRISAVFISHGNDDVMAAIVNLVKEINVPIYTAPLTAYLIESMFKEAGIKKYDLHRVQRNSTFEVDGVEIKTFGVTESIADAMGIAIKTDHGYIVYGSEFIFDFDVKIDAFKCDISRLANLGDDGVLLLMGESVASTREGHSAPHHKLTPLIEPYFEETEDRIVITMYNQNLFRLIEVIELANKYNRKIMFYDDKLREFMQEVAKLGYYHVPAGLEVPKSKFDNKIENIVVIISGSGSNIFKRVQNITNKEDPLIEFRKSDTIIIASPSVPGTVREANRMENALYKEGAKVYATDKKRMFSMHAAIEDLKMMMHLLKPKYYMPVKGEYNQLISNANIALDMGYKAENIIVMDNGQVATIKNGELEKQYDQIEIEDVMVDGKASLDSSGMVLRDREKLSTDGAIIVGIVINHKTKKIIGGPDVQSRGVIYLKDAEHIVKEIGIMMENIIETAVKNNKYDNMTCRMEAREAIGKYVLKETGKHPMILPAIIEINTTE